MRMENRVAWVSAILIVIILRESVTAETNNAWEYQCQLSQNVTDVVWMLNMDSQLETLSSCHVESQSCDQRLDDCTLATINSISSLLYISDTFEREKAGRVGYAEIIDDGRAEIRFDAKRNPINWACGPLSEITRMFRSTLGTSVSTDSLTEETSPPKGFVTNPDQSTQSIHSRDSAGSV